MMSVYFGTDNSSYPDSLHVPLIDINYRGRNDLQVSAFLDDLPEFTHLVFTSKHGVESLFRHISPSALSGKKIISIGAKTTSVLEKYADLARISHKFEPDHLHPSGHLSDLTHHQCLMDIASSRSPSASQKSDQTDCSPPPQLCEKSGLTRISHKISSKGVQDGASDLFSPGREHYQRDKGSPGENKGDVADCADLPRGCEKCGLVDQTATQETQEGVLHVLNLMDLSNAYIGIPCSSRARTTLSTLLAYRGVRHLIGHLYDTHLIEDAVIPDLNTISKLIFTSPSTVDAFNTYIDKLPNHLSFAFQGPVTQQRFEQLYSRN